MSFLAPLALLFGFLTVPVVVMYLLKRKRKPLQVPSTWLWMRSIEDLRVNAPFQRLRRSLLLLLQLLLIAIATLALARPMRLEERSEGRWVILLVDRSASMGATDVAPSRLEAAKRAAGELIDGLADEDPVMVVAFSSRAEVVAPLTTDHRAARSALESIRPAPTSTRIREALQMGIASAKQNARSEIFVLSDGNFEPAQIKTFGVPIRFVPIGSSKISNAAVTALDVRRPAALGEPWAVFASLDRFGGPAEERALELHVNGSLRAVKKAAFSQGRSTAAVIFELQDEPRVVEARLAGQDDLAADDRAWQVVERRGGKVLVVTPGNFFLEQALAQLREIQVDRTQMGDVGGIELSDYDLVVFDGAAPETLDEGRGGRYLFWDCLPPWEGFREEGPAATPVVVDWDRRHPVTRMVDLSALALARAKRVSLPAYAKSLVDMPDAPLVAAWHKGEVRAIAVAFDLLESDWPLHLSFPLFVSNAVEWLRREGGGEWRGHRAAGEPIRFRLPEGAAEATVTGPSGRKAAARPTSPGEEVAFMDTWETGLYVVEAGERTDAYAVNLLDPAESSGRVADELRVGEDSIKGQEAPPPPPKEYWTWLGWSAFALLCLEWFVFHRRVA